MSSSWTEFPMNAAGKDPQVQNARGCSEKLYLQADSAIETA